MADVVVMVVIVRLLLQVQVRVQAYERRQVQFVPDMSHRVAQQVCLVLLSSFHFNALIVRFVFGKLTGKIKCDKEV